MIIYYSIILWFLLMWFFYSASARGRVHNNLQIHQQINRVPWGLAILTFGYLSFWVGMRTAFVDTAAYIQMFDGLDTSKTTFFSIISNRDKGYGFTILMFIFKSICPHTQCWLLFLALLSCGCVMVTLKRYSPHFWLSSLIYILSCSFAWSMNGIRQYFCVTILFACFPLLVQRRWLSLILITLIISTVHQTAIIMLPMFYVALSKPWSKLMIISILLTAGIVNFTGIFNQALNIAIEGSDYENVTEKFGAGVSVIRVLFFSIPAVIAFVWRHKLSGARSKELDICINMSVLTACLYFIGSVTSGIIMGRLPIYCQLFSYILIAYEAKIIFRNSNRGVFTWGYILLFFVFFLIQTGGRYYYQSDITGRLH